MELLKCLIESLTLFSAGTCHQDSLGYLVQPLADCYLSDCPAWMLVLLHILFSLLTVSSTVTSQTDFRPEDECFCGGRGGQNKVSSVQLYVYEEWPV